MWFDVHELPMGTDWSAAIDRAIVECDTLVLVGSRAALASPYVQRERDRAAELARPQVAVLREWVKLPAAPALPTYDLTTSFTRGVDALARDIAARRPTGRRPRIRLPLPGGALLFALAPALSLVFVAVLTALFLNEVVGNVASFAPDADVALAVAATMILLAGGFPVYVLWSFLRRRMSWFYLRGALLTMPLVALLTVVTVDATVTPITNPILSMLGGTEEMALGLLPTVLALLVVLVCIVAAIATELSSGLCRFLRTGVAPRRVRFRHIGAVPRPVDRRNVVRSYRLSATDHDATVAAEIRQCLAESGLDEVTDGRLGDRDIVVVTDRTPAGWLAREDLRAPIGVVATSISLPLRGVLGRFQWVDYRRRRKQTLRALGRDLTAVGGPVAEGGEAPDVPERLQQLRQPPWVTIAEWTLFTIGVIAAQVGVYALALLAFEDRRALVWPSGLLVAVAPFPFLLAFWLRRRRLTPRLLLGAVAVCWLVMIPLGLDPLLQEQFPTYDRGSYSAATIIYPALSALILALAWRSLRRWLPRRLHTGAGADPALGYARGSLVWLVFLIPAVMTSAAQAVLDSTILATPEPALAAPERAAADICRDRDGLSAVGEPFSAASAAINDATAPRTVRAAVARRIPVTTSVIRELERYETASSWGADIKNRLIAGLERILRADAAYLDGKISAVMWFEERAKLLPVTDDLVAPTC